MARARRVVTLDEKIDKAQAEVAEAKAKLDKKIDVLEKLLTKRKEMESKELLKAFVESERTLCIRRIPVAAFAAVSGHGAERVAGFIEF